MTLPISWSKGTLPPIVGTGVTLGSEGIGTADTDSILFTQTSGSASLVRWDFAEEETELNVAARVYFRTPATWPSASFNVLVFNNAASGMIAGVAFSGTGGPGQFRLLRTGGSTVASSATGAIATSTWYRVELQMKGTATQARAAIFPADSNTPIWSSAWETHADFGVAVRRVSVGSVNSTPTVAPFSADEILIAALPAPDAWLGAPPITATPVGLQARLAQLASAIARDVATLQAESRAGKLINPLGMAQWQAAVHGHLASTARAVVIGDSNTEGAGTGLWYATWPARLQALIRARKGIRGGDGYIGSTPTTGAYVVAPPVTRTGTTQSMGGWGLGGRSASVSAAGSSVTYDPRVCDRIRVWYGKTSLYGGNFDVKIDGVTVTSLNSNGGAANSDGAFWDSGVLTRGPHTVSFSSPNGWIGIIDGVEFFDGDYGTGVQVYNAGHHGYTTDSFNMTTNPNIAMHWQHLSAIAPQLVVIMLGSNDLLGQQTVAQFAANLEAMIGYISPTASVLIVMPPTRGDGRTAELNIRWAEMRVAAAALATGRVSFLDLEHWWPSIGAASSTWAGLMFDLIHLNTAGYELLAEIVADHICAPIRR